VNETATTVGNGFTMQLCFDEIFKYSDILNPISPTTLFNAGKLAELDPNKVILDLGSGKGSPSILWASLFGVQVEGYDFGSNFVQYANSRAKMLNLSHRVMFYCKDVKELKVTRAYDAVASLGLGIARTFGNIHDALKKLQTMLLKGGFLIFAEPVWLAEDIPLEVLGNLDATEEDFLTKFEVQQVMKRCGFRVKGSFDSSKEDWELYIRPVNYAMSEVIESTGELAEEAQTVIRSFKAEYDAVNQYWNMVLWVVEAV
jgi:ubiquinone/menaquinone biosynthesis C-methylase UbiE